MMIHSFLFIVILSWDEIEIVGVFYCIVMILSIAVYTRASWWVVDVGKSFSYLAQRVPRGRSKHQQGSRRTPKVEIQV